MGTQKREGGSFSPDKREGQPGPGMYDPKLGEGQSFKFDKAEYNREGDKHPGPGYYYIPVKFADVPRYLIPEQEEQYKWV